MLEAATPESGSIKNPFLTEIFKELHSLYCNGGMDGHLLYLFGVVVKNMQRDGAQSAIGGLSVGDILLESVSSYPWNWYTCNYFIYMCMDMYSTL